MTSIQINWSQTGKFRDYNISRYIVTATSTDNQQSNKVYYDTQNLNSSKPFYNNKLAKRALFNFYLFFKAVIEPMYFEPYLPEPIHQCPDESTCYEKCIESSTCVQFVYYKEQQKCHLINSFNPANGIEDSNAIIRTIRCNYKLYYYLK